MSSSQHAKKDQCSGSASSQLSDEEVGEDDQRGASSQPLAVRTKMERGISRVVENEYLIHQARSKVENDFSAPKKVADVTSGSRSRTDPVSGGEGRRQSSCHHQHSRDHRHSPDSPDSGGSGGSIPIPGSIVAGGFIETPVYTFTLPDLTCYQDDFRRFLEKDLIELSSLVSLEQSGRLNWWSEIGVFQRLWPLATSGDGNCLLHAASLGMWGFHDRLLTLRKALHAFLSSSQSSAAIYRRWRWQCHQQNSQCGLTLSDSEWEEEWRCVLRLASPEPRSSSAMSSSASSNGSTRRRSRLSINACSLSSSPTEEPEMGRTSVGGSSSEGGESTSALYESLEEVHVLALAHILRRPIIVVADTILRDMNGEALAPIPFGGIYLPLECPASDCHKSPLLLTYNAGHFSALVTMQSNTQNGKEPLPVVIPVTDSDHILLPIQFAVDPGPDFNWGEDEFLFDSMSKLTLGPTEQLTALNAYLDLVKVDLPDWVIESQRNPAAPPLPVNPSLGSGHRSKSSSSNGGSKSSKQSAVKQLGSFGKRLRKNLSKLGKSSHRSSEKHDEADRRSTHPRNSIDDSVTLSHQLQQHHQHRPTVTARQNFILGASINTGRVFPYQYEMVNNYLEEAHRRYEKESQSKAKVRQEQIEQEERRQREIYLNGGFVDCVNAGCQGQGTSDTSYLCKTCYSHQQSLRRQQQQQNQPTLQHQISRSSGEFNARTHQVTCQYHPQANGHYSKSTFYVSNTTNPLTPTANTGAVLPIPAHHSSAAPSYTHARKQNLYSRNDEVFNTVVPYHHDDGRRGAVVDDVDSHHPHGFPVDTEEIMRVKLPPPATPTASPSSPTGSIDTRPCRNSSCEFYGTSEFAFYCSKCYSKFNKPTAASAAASR